MNWLLSDKQPSGNIIRWGFVFLCVAGFAGLVMRLLPYAGIRGLNYSHLLHAHSHIAILGWSFLVLFGFFVSDFERTGHTDGKRYRLIALAFIFILFGILAGFIWQGYGWLSILFLTLHVFLSYLLGYHVFRNYRNENIFSFSSYRSFLKTGYFFHLFSTIPLLLLGLVVHLYGKQSALYQNAIYYYMHFQYNGFLLLCVLGFLLRELERHGVVFNDKMMSRALNCLNLSVLFTMYLSFVWAWPRALYFVIGGVGVLLQAYALVLMAGAVRVQALVKKRFHFSGLLISLSLALVLKTILQGYSAIPDFVPVIFGNRSFIIFYLHLVFLGIIGFGLLFLCLQRYDIRITLPEKILCLAGFWGIQGALLVNGGMTWLLGAAMPFYHAMLALCSGIFFISICLFTWRMARMKMQN